MECGKKLTDPDPALTVIQKIMDGLGTSEKDELKRKLLFASLSELFLKQKDVPEKWKKLVITDNTIRSKILHPINILSVRRVLAAFHQAQSCGPARELPALHQILFRAEVQRRIADRLLRYVRFLQERRVSVGMDLQSLYREHEIQGDSEYQGGVEEGHSGVRGGVVRIESKVYFGIDYKRDAPFRFRRVL